MKGIARLVVLLVTLAATAPLHAGERPPKVVETWPSTVPGLNCPFVPYEKIPRRKFAKWGGEYVDAFLVGGGRFETPEVKGTISIDWCAEPKLLQRDFILGAALRHCLHEETPTRRLLGMNASCTGKMLVGKHYLISISIRALKPSVRTHMIDTFLTGSVDGRGQRDDSKILAWRKEAGRSLLLALETFARQALAVGGEQRAGLTVAVAIDEGERPYRVQVRVRNADGSPAGDQPVGLYFWGPIVQCYWSRLLGERRHVFTGPVDPASPHAKGMGTHRHGLRARTDSQGRATFSLAHLGSPDTYTLASGTALAGDGASTDMSNHAWRGRGRPHTLSGPHLATRIAAGIKSGRPGVRVYAMARVGESGDHTTWHRSPCRGESKVVHKDLDYVARVVRVIPLKHPLAKPTWLIRHLRLPGEEERKHLADGDRLRPNDELLLRQWERIELEFAVVSKPGTLVDEDPLTHCLIAPNAAVLGTRTASLIIQSTRYGTGFRSIREEQRNEAALGIGITVLGTLAGGAGAKKQGAILGFLISGGSAIYLATRDRPLLLHAIKSKVWLECLAAGSRTAVFQGSVDVYGGPGGNLLTTVGEGRHATCDLVGEVLAAGPLDHDALSPFAASTLPTLGIRLPEGPAREDDREIMEFRFGVGADPRPPGSTDWRAGALHLRTLTHLLHQAQGSFTAGRTMAPDVEERISEEKRLLVAFEESAAVQLGIGGPYNALIHPAVTANLLAALLVLTERPLTPEQRREILEAGEAWVAFARRSEAQLPPHVPVIAHVHADVDGRLRFLRALKAILTPEQRSLAFLPETENRVGLDVLSPASAYARLQKVQGSDRDQLARSLIQELFTAAGFRVHDLSPWRREAYDWLEALDEASLRSGVDRDIDVAFPRVQDLQRLAWIQAQATHRIAQVGGLGAEHVEALRRVQVLLIPQSRVR